MEHVTLGLLNIISLPFMVVSVFLVVVTTEEVVTGISVVLVARVDVFVLGGVSAVLGGEFALVEVVPVDTVLEVSSGVFVVIKT